MNEENTQSLTSDEKLNLILAELKDVKTRLTALEAIAEDGSRETRPLLHLIHKEIADTRADVAELKDRADRSDARLARMEDLMQLMNNKFEVFTLDHSELRVGQRWQDKRITAIEQGMAETR